MFTEVWSWVLRFVELPKLLQTHKYQFVLVCCLLSLQNSKGLKLPSPKFTAFSSQAFMGMFIRITCPNSVACCLTLSQQQEVSTIKSNEVIELLSSSLTFKEILIQANASFNISHNWHYQLWNNGVISFKGMKIQSDDFHAPLWARYVLFSCDVKWFISH